MEDQEDTNILFRLIKAKHWAKVRELLLSSMSASANANATTRSCAIATATTELDKGQDQQQPRQLLLQADAHNNVPLHIAIGYQAPDDLLLEMMEIYPGAAKIHGANDWLPLHVAAMYGASPAVLTKLIRIYPQALEDRGEGGIKGRTPRHFKDRFPHNQSLLSKSTQEWMQEALLHTEQD